MNDDKDLSLYIHWPFCLSKCPYCSFNSYVKDGINQDEWVEYYIDELTYYHFLFEDRNIRTIYFGGGTPSLMNVKTVANILNEINNLWGIGEDVEITMEANPTSADIEKFRSFRLCGVNRMSLGVQSLREGDLKKLGRRHTLAEALQSLEMINMLFDRSSFDLIYAREDQTLLDWEYELKEAVKYANGHMSLYQLTIEGGTKFYNLYQRGKLKKLDEEVSADMYNLTLDIMEDSGMPAYEVSNFARLGEESRHNLVYWNYKDYAGIGAGAHGRITASGKKMAVSNLALPDKWNKRIGQPVIEVVGDKEEIYEELLMGLRMFAGIKWKDYFDVVINKEKLNHAIAEKLIVIEDGNIRLTRSGIIRLDSVLSYILI